MMPLLVALGAMLLGLPLSLARSPSRLVDVAALLCASSAPRQPRCPLPAM
jgi:hypothetical protein